MNIRILVVEDNAISAELIKTALQREGYEIAAVVDSGEEAIVTVRRACPDLVLMDIILSGAMDGIETANHLRTVYNLPIVYLTANADQATLVRAKITAPSAYLLKPFNKRELQIAIEIALYKHQMEQRLLRLNVVLQTIQKVHQFMAKERNRRTLLQGVCDLLLETGGYQAAWIALPAASGRMELIAQAGLAERAAGVGACFERGRPPGCVALALAQTTVLSVSANAGCCLDCPLRTWCHQGQGAYCAQLALAETVYGVLNVALSAKFAAAAEEQALFEELADGLAFVLYRIELEEEQQRAEGALRESEARYRELFENMQSGVAVYAVTENGRDFIFKDFNKAGEQIEDEPRENLIGKSIFEARPGVEKFGLIDILRKVWETGQAAFYPAAFYEDSRQAGWYENFVYKLPSGEIVAVFENVTERKRAAEDLRKYRDHLEELVQERTTQLTQANARLEAEISERKQAEAETETIARRLRAMIETVGEGITLSDETGYFEIFNSKMEAITGYTKAEANQSGDFLKRLYPDPVEHCYALAGLQEIMQTGGSRDLETRIQAKDGTLKTLLVSTVVMQTQPPRWFLSAYRDISERQRAEKELRDAKDAADIANQAKSEFLANMSHELRTPLNAILGYAQILKTADPLTEQQREGLETIKSSGEHLLTLINEILDLSKIEAGQMDLHIQALHLPEFFKSIADLMRIRAEQKGIRFVYTCDPTLPIGIYTDAKRLREVLVNLLENAIKFTPHGTVSLRVCEFRAPAELDHAQTRQIPDAQMHKILVDVEDTGIGIAPDKLNEIFLPFQQIREQHSVIEGTGLGLAISQRLVAMLGGELHVQSTPGQGSIFRFGLSLLAAPDFVLPPKPDSQRIVGYKGKPRTILVVDDERTNRAVLAGMLSSLGFKMIEAVNGQEAIAQALQWKPALIFLDLRMPVLDGFGATQQLRQIETFRDVPILAISASVFAETRQRALAVGFNDFLVKPFHLEELLALLHTYLPVEWIYADLVQPSGSEDLRGPERTPGVRLPRSAATPLIEFAELGMAKELLLALKKLETEEAAYLPLITKLRQLVKAYQFDQILELLNG